MVAEFDDLEVLASTFRREPIVRKVKRMVPLFVRGECEGRRLKSNVEPPFLVILDFDKVTRSIEWVSERLRLFDVDHVGYTTHSHGELEDVHSFRIMTDHVATTWGELRDIAEQLFKLVNIKPTQESWTSPGWFAPAVHPDRLDEFEYVENLNRGSLWFPKRLNVDEYDAPKPKRDRVAPEDVNLPEIESALDAIPNDDVHYDDWLQIGMALHSTGSDETLKLWEMWSEKSGKHDSDYCELKWNSFSDDREEAVTLGTVFHYAKEEGWEREGAIPSVEDDFDDYLPFDERGDDYVAPNPRWDARLSGLEGDKGRKEALKAFNERFVQLPSRVLDTMSGTDGLIFHKLNDFAKFYSHPQFVHPTKKGTEKEPNVYESIGKMWLEWKHRKRQERIDILPPGGPERLSPDVYNRWRGWGVEREEGELHLPFLDHVFENVCSGNDEWNAWVIAWLAHMVQKPWEKPGTALVLRSDSEGTGKGVFGMAILKLAGYQGFKINTAERLTGRFNDHLFGRIFVFADEVTWGGNKTSSDVLKGLTSELVLDYEAKGAPTFQGRSFTRLLLTGNSSWMVSASATSRRWQVFDVSEKHKQDEPYFLRILNSLKRGGHSHLLDYLSNVDLSDLPNPRKIVSTHGLVNQKLLSLDSVDQWIHNVLTRGYILETHEDACIEDTFSKSDVYQNYIDESAKVGIKRRSNEVHFGRRLKEVFGGDLRTPRPRTDEGGRPMCYQFPPLDVARKSFEANVIQGETEWGDEDDEEEEE